MGVRGKLIDLILDAKRTDHETGSFTEYLADYLISNGVTVKEWISVKDRMPEYPGHYLVCTSINYWHGECMDINENHKYYPNGTPVGYDGSTMSVIDCYYDWEENL